MLILAMVLTSIGFTSIEVNAATKITIDSYSGSVKLSNSKGKKKTLKEGAHLVSGDNLTTGKKSNAYVLLDETKAAQIEENSSVDVAKKGNSLDLTVDKGAVFFDVSKKLDSNESFKIKSSNMVCGIRGTIGEVRVKKNKKKKTVTSNIYLLEGAVKISYKNGKKKVIKTVNAGQKIAVSTNTKTKKSVAKIVPLESSDIKQIVAQTISSNEVLRTRVETAVTTIDWTTTLEEAIAGNYENTPILELNVSSSKAWKTAYKNLLKNPSKKLKIGSSEKIMQYSLIDIYGDKVPELLIGTYSGGGNGRYYDCYYVSYNEKKGAYLLLKEGRGIADSYVNIDGKPASMSTSYMTGDWSVRSIEVSSEKVTYGSTIASGTYSTKGDWEKKAGAKKVVMEEYYSSLSEVEKAIDKY